MKLSHRGWIKIHRSIQSHWLWESEKPFDKRSAWIDILLLVNHEGKKVLLGNEITYVNRGEHITSEPKLAERWGWSRTKVRNFLRILEKENMIENKKEGKKRTRLIVLNYNDYQGSENNERTREEQDKDKEKTSEEQGENINKNDKNEKNDKNDKEDILMSQQSCNDELGQQNLKFIEESTEIALARFMIKEMLRVKPDSRVPKDNIKSLQNWAKHIDYMIRLDKREPRQIAELFRWAQNDTFWCANIRSPQKLRKQWDTLELRRAGEKKPKQNDNLAYLEEMYREAKAKEDGLI